MPKKTCPQCNDKMGKKNLTIYDGTEMHKNCAKRLGLGEEKFEEYMRQKHQRRIDLKQERRRVKLVCEEKQRKKTQQKIKEKEERREKKRGLNAEARQGNLEALEKIKMRNAARNRIKEECMEKVALANPEFIQLQNERSAMMHNLNGLMAENKKSSIDVFYDLDLDYEHDMYEGVELTSDFNGEDTHEECDKSCKTIVENVKRIYDQRKKIINMKKEYATINVEYEKEKKKYDEVVKLVTDKAIAELENTFS